MSDKKSPSNKPETTEEHQPEQKELFTDNVEPENEPEEAIDPIVTLTEERDDLKDQLLRIMAETENFKKRAQRDKADFLKRANEGLIKDLLPVLDNFERALDAAKESDDTNGMLEGLELIQQEFSKVLEKNGLEEVEAMGKVFDPEFHEAMMQQEDNEAEENTVLCVYQKGYLYQGRLIRPAMVVVSKKPSGSYSDDGSAVPCDDKGNKIDIKIN